MSRASLLERVRESVETLHAAETRQLTLPAAAEPLGRSIQELLFGVLLHLVSIHQLSSSSSAAQRLLREAHCADAAILLALIGAHPATHA